MNCELCAFNNPKTTVTAVIIQNGKLLLVKRNEEPFKGMWDFPGGYMQPYEMPDIALRRELKEELNVESTLTKIGEFPGTAIWKDKQFPIITHAFLAEIEGKIKLNDENSEYIFVPLDKIAISKIAFDSNRILYIHIRFKLYFDIRRIKELVKQLDPNATVNEQSLYKAALNGFARQVYEGNRLVGLGWIFLRQTMLRKQAVIEDMIVDEAYRGKGYGGKILEELIKWAKDNGVEVVELTTNPKRIAAHGLYEKYGFKIHPTDHMLLKL